MPKGCVSMALPWIYNILFCFIMLQTALIVSPIQKCFEVRLNNKQIHYSVRMFPLYLSHSSCSRKVRSSHLPKFKQLGITEQLCSINTCTECIAELLSFRSAPRRCNSSQKKQNDGHIHLNQQYISSLWDDSEKAVAVSSIHPTWFFFFLTDGYIAIAFQTVKINKYVVQSCCINSLIRVGLTCIMLIMMQKVDWFKESDAK